MNNAKFNKYKVDKKLQEDLSSHNCHKIAKYYFDKLGGSSSPKKKPDKDNIWQQTSETHAT